MSRVTRDELFQYNWRRAVENFKLRQYWQGNGIDYIHAEAGTGFKYEVFSVHIPSEWRDRERHTCFVTVSQPWNATWTTIWESWAFPSYVAEHWIRPAGRDTHGGDAAALTICVNAVLGHDIEESIHRAKEWS